VFGVCTYDEGVDNEPLLVGLAVDIVNGGMSPVMTSRIEFSILCWLTESFVISIFILIKKVPHRFALR
jgi:hypothetical protein